MSKYTTQLRFVIEQLVKDSLIGEGKTDEANAYTIWDESQWGRAWERMGLADWPERKDGERDRINRLICRHYIMNEIGCETLGQWAWFVRAHMMEVMPYYNKLYDMVDAVENPLDEIDMRYTNSIDTTDSSTSNTQGSTKAHSVMSDTPMSMIDQGIDDIEKGKYASEASYSGDESNTDTSSSSTSNLDQGKTEKGRRHALSKVVKDYSEGIMAIDRRLVEEMGQFFFLLW